MPASEYRCVPIVPYRVLSYPVVSYCVLSCPVVSCVVPSCLSCPSQSRCLLWRPLRRGQFVRLHSGDWLNEHRSKT